VVHRFIRPTLQKAGIDWKGLYAGRRGAATGNYRVDDPPKLKNPRKVIGRSELLANRSKSKSK